MSNLTGSLQAAVEAAAAEATLAGSSDGYQPTLPIVAPLAVSPAAAAAAAAAALSVFKSNGDIGALLSVLSYEEREVEPDDWKSFSAAEIIAARKYLRVAELNNKRQRDAILSTGVLTEAIGVKPQTLARLYWCSKCTRSRKPGPRTRIISHILSHQNGASDTEMDCDRDRENLPASAADSASVPLRLKQPSKQPSKPVTLSDPLASAARLSFFPRDMSFEEVDELLQRHAQFKHFVITKEQRQAVHAHLRCVSLKDTTVRDAAFSAPDASLSGLSQMKTTHTTYYCKCLEYCFRNIGAMMTHILKTHCISPPGAQLALVHTRSTSKRLRTPAMLVVEEEEEEDEEEEDVGRLHKKQRRNRPKELDDHSEDDSDLHRDSSCDFPSKSGPESDSEWSGSARDENKGLVLGRTDLPSSGRPSTLSQSDEIKYMRQLHFHPSEPSCAQWARMRAWEEVDANWPLVRRQIVCERVPRQLRPDHAFRKSQLLRVPGLSLLRDNHVLFSCRCGTQPYRRLADTSVLLRHILWSCSQTPDVDAAAAAAAPAAELSPPTEHAHVVAELAETAPSPISDTADRRDHAAAAAASSDDRLVDLVGANGCGSADSLPSVSTPDVPIASDISPMREEIATLKRQLSQQSVQANEQQASLRATIVALQQQLSDAHESQFLGAAKHREAVEKQTNTLKDTHKKQLSMKDRELAAARLESSVLRKMLAQSRKSAEQEVRYWMEFARQANGDSEPARQSDEQTSDVPEVVVPTTLPVAVVPAAASVGGLVEQAAQRE